MKPIFEKFVHGRTLYLLADVILTEEEGKQVEGHQFESAILSEDGARYRVVIDDLYEQLPPNLSDSEIKLVLIAQKIGYVEAMAEQELWSKFGLAKIRAAGVEKNKEIAAPTHARMAKRYDELLKKIKDLPARKQIAKEEGFTMKHVRDVLRKQGRC